MAYWLPPPSSRGPLGEFGGFGRTPDERDENDGTPRMADMIDASRLESLPTAEMKFGQETFLRCNGAEVPHLLSMRKGDDMLWRLKFARPPALGKRGRVVNLEFYRDDGWTQSVSGILGAVKVEAAIGQLTVIHATIRPKRGARRQPSTRRT